MRVLLQRVSRASVTVDGATVARIGPGMLLLVGVRDGDDEQVAEALARKLAVLRVFPDDEGRMNRSVLDTGGEALVVSQFTLYADTRKGRRPSYVHAARPETAEPLIEYFSAQLREAGVPTQSGQFGANMQVDLVNDGPVTIWFDSDAP